MHNTVFEFNLHESVFITELERTGIIISIWVTIKGIQYEVRYFDNAIAKTVYFFEWELTKI